MTNSHYNSSQEVIIMEIERQFLISRLPLPKECDTIRQGYVALMPEIRIRQVNDSDFTLTVKRGIGLVR